MNYHLLIIHEAGLISADFNGETFWMINRLTWKGHEYLDLIRDDKKLKWLSDIAEKFGVKSLESLFSIASRAIETAALEALKTQFPTYLS